MLAKLVNIDVQVWREAEFKCYNADRITQIQLVKPCYGCFIVRYRQGTLDELNIPKWNEWFSRHFENFNEALDEYKLKSSLLC